MRYAIDIVVCICMLVALYFNLTSVPKQDYIHNNPWKRSVTSGPLEKVQHEQ